MATTRGTSRTVRIRRSVLALGVAVALLGLTASPASGQGDAPRPAEGAALFYKIGWANTNNLSLINPDGSNNQVVRPVSFGQFDYTADGQKLVFRSTLASGNNIYLENQNGAVFPVGILGSEPELSPDGNRIVYTRRDSAGDDVVDVVSLTGQLLAALGPGSQPTFSPDGTEVMFVKEGPEVEVGCVGSPDTDTLSFSGLAVAPSSGGASSWVLEPGREIETDRYWGSPNKPEWSPDGETVVFYGREEIRQWNGVGGSSSDCLGSNEGSDNDISVMPSDGGEPLNLTGDFLYEDDPTPDEFHPSDLNASFSPDGEHIAFASGRRNLVNPGTNNIHSLWVMDKDGSDQREVLVTSRVDETDWMTALPEGAQVTIDAFDAQATEAGPTPGTFLIERTGATDGPLEVDIDLANTSTATSGVDFAALPDTVTIPDGSTSVNLVVQPVNDSLVEGSETIVAKVVAGGGYFVGNPSTATITIADRSSVYRPDALIRRGGAEGYRGGNVYNGTGTGQTRSVTSARGTIVTFQIKAQNDGNDDDGFEIKGPAGNTSAYRVRYYAGATEITNQVIAGTYGTGPLAPAASVVITVKVTVKQGAAAGSNLTRSIKVSRASGTPAKDVVQLVVRPA